MSDTDVLNVLGDTVYKKWDVTSGIKCNKHSCCSDKYRNST
jgi:hypothetical protein